VLRAVRDRLEALVDSVIAPLKDAVQQLIDLVNALDLKPLRDAVDETYQALRGQIAALHPDKLLGDIVKAFKDAQKTVADFNPLADIQAALTELRDAITRVLGKLKPSEILATPISIYEEIVGVLEKLDLNALLTPLYDQIDGLAQQVDQGLKGAVDSFQRLQDALPSQVGSTSLTASASAGGG